jgi:hypothetical protein
VRAGAIFGQEHHGHHRGHPRPARRAASVVRTARRVPARRLEILLETHAEAEELYFYPELLKLGKGASDAKSEGVDGEVKDAIKDHNEIRDAIRKAREHEVCSDDWWKAVVECRVQNSDHMAEEERQDLADFRQHAGLDLRQDIAMRFLRYEAVKAASGIPLENKDPRTYVHDMGESS